MIQSSKGNNVIFKDGYYLIYLTVILVIVFLFNSCMMMGMHKKPLPNNADKKETSVLEIMMDQAVRELAGLNTKIESVAVWPIRSKTTGLDLENIRQQLINNLVNTRRFNVISREHFDALLQEQSMADSGLLDTDKAISLGGLIGINGFVTGYLSKSSQSIELNLNLIETRTGKIVWSKSQREKL